ncbi:MAG: hypothetical protein ABSC94_16065 [Polyangiaceae bacterium]
MCDCVRSPCVPLLAAWLALDGCGPSIPHPPYSPQGRDALVLIDFAPPPGRVEQVPRRPHGANAWVDGEWIRRRARWYWLVGRWVAVPPGWTYSPWVVVRALDGTVFYAPSLWKDASGRATDAPSPLAFATASAQAVAGPEGNVEPTGRNLRTAPAPPVLQTSGPPAAPPASAQTSALPAPPPASPLQQTSPLPDTVDAGMPITPNEDASAPNEDASAPGPPSGAPSTPPDFSP